MATIGYIVSFEANQTGKSSSGKDYTYGMLTWITNEGNERKDRLFDFGDTQKDYNLLKKIEPTSKISAELKQNGKFMNLVGGTVKYLNKGTGTIPVEKKEKPKSNWGGKKPFDNTEKEKRVTFVWAIHNTTEYARLVKERNETDVPLDAIVKIRKRLLLEAYKFKTPEIGRSFIGVAISLYQEEQLKDLNAVIERAGSLHEEYVTVAKEIVTKKEEDDSVPVPEEENNAEPTPEENNNPLIEGENFDDLPF